jgi:glyoxylase-like metal-dependent hydrolase (beta-lactamase superfamily II)
MQPGVEEVARGVHRIPLPLPNDGLQAVNVYALTGADGGPVIIDSGWAIPEARERLQAGLATLGADIRDVDRFLVTHIHRDHYTQAVHLRREFGTRVTLGAQERWSLDMTMRQDRHALQEQTNRLRELGAAALADRIAAHNSGGVDVTDWELPDDWFTAAEVVEANGRSLDVVETPGHTRGHVVFHDVANRLLFAGDHVLPTITPSIGFEPAFTPDPLGDFLRSLAEVRRRPDAMLLPAHGAVTPSAHARVDELVEHHEKRLAAVERVVGWGAQTAAGVAAELPWTRREHRLADLDMFNQFLAIGETAAHLDLLVLQERLSVTTADGVHFYAIP